MIEYFNGYITVNVNHIDKLSELTQEEANHIATGPQDLFFSKLESVNSDLHHYGVDNIDVTPKWNWKPGSYDKMKEYLNKKLDIHKKAKAMDNLVNRTYDRLNYLGYIKRQIEAMEFERYNLKRLGVSRDVNIDEFKEKCIVFVNHLSEQCDKVFDITNQSILMIPYIDVINSRSCDYYLDIQLDNLNLSIYDDNNLIQDFPLKRLHIIVKQSLRHKLSNVRTSNIKFSGWYGDNDGLKTFHPYISNMRNGRDYGNVCLDKHTDDIYKAFKDNNLVSMAMLLMQWAQYFNIKHANPYNQLYMNHFGMPKSFNESYRLTQDKDGVISSCVNRLKTNIRNKEFSYMGRIEFVANFCDTIECSLRDICQFSKVENQMLNIANSESGYRIEAMIMEIISVLQKMLVNGATFEEINNNFSSITGSGIVYYRYERRDDDGETYYDIEGIWNAYATKLFKYYATLANDNTTDYNFDMYTRIFWEDNGLSSKEPKPDEDIKLNEDEQATLMKQWVNAQGGR